MSFFGNLLKIVAIGAFFVATGPFGLAVGNTLATALRIGGFVAGYLGALIDRPRLLAERQRIILGTTLDPGTPIPVVYGRGKVGGIIADWFLQPVNNFKELYDVVVLCHGSQDGLGVAGVDEIWLDGRKAIVSGSGRVWPYKQITSNYKVFLGSTVQNVGATNFYTEGTPIGITSPSNVSGSGWNSTTDLGKGICCIGFVFLNVDTNTFSQAAIAITSNSAANPTVVTTTTAHGFNSGDSVRIASHTGSTPSINGEWVVTVTSTTQFTIPANVSVGGGATGTARRFSEGPAFRGPPSVQAVIRGNRIYDTRTDTWMPGGDNPAMVIRDYLTAPIYGCGFSVGLLNEQSFKDMADYCDALVRHVVGSPVTISNSDAATERVNTSTSHGWATGTLVRIAGHSGSTPDINGDHLITVTSSTSFTLNDVANITVGGTGGTATKLIEQKRYTCNGVLDTSRSTGENLDELKSSCRGQLVWEQGQFKLTIRSELVAAPTVTLSPANILGEWSFRNAGQEEKWNVVKASYVDPMNGEFKSQDVQWPRVGTSNAYLIADNNFQNTLDLNLPFTNDQLTAQMTAQIILNEARFGISCSVLCTEEALALSVGDKVNVTHPTPGWTAKPFWVVALDLMPNTSVLVSLQEYDPAAYSLSTMDDRRTFAATTLDSIFSVPAPGTVTITGLSPQGIKISWLAASYGMIDFYEVQARLTSGGEDYVTIERVRESNAVFEAIDPLARPGQTWDARVRVVNVVGWPSPWTDATQFVFPVPPGLQPGVGAATWTGKAPTISIPTSPPTLTSVIRTETEDGDLCAGNQWIQQILWHTTGANDTDYRIDIDMANNSAGTNYTSLVTDLPTADSSTYDDTTGISGNLTGVTAPATYYRKYKVKVVRRSDLNVMQSMETTQDSIIIFADSCP